MEPPQYPAGPYQEEVGYGAPRLRAFTEQIAQAPGELKRAVAGLSERQLDTRYRNWTIRQIVHHIADSHINSYVRFKWALTEDQPTIKPYDEGRWAALADSLVGGIEPTLALFEGLHARWALLLGSMTLDQFARSFVHPDTGATVRLDGALSYYAWHFRHHIGQILWVRKQRSWDP